MQLPAELQQAIDEIALHSPALRKARERLSQVYREGGVSPFGDEAARLAYLGARMPATYAAVRRVLSELPSVQSLLDLGAGPGTASWAAVDLFPEIQQIVLVEKSGEAVGLGKRLAEACPHPALRNGQWLVQDLMSPVRPADVAVFSYVLNEIREFWSVVEPVWEKVNFLVVVEPGTPKGFQNILKVRERLLQKGAHLLAPCPHAFACPIQGADWCHFAARVERTRLHRLLKEGALGFEDEKFSYLIAAKERPASFEARVVRHPLKQSGFVRLPVCAKSGRLEEWTATKKDRAFYKVARDLEWGERIVKE